MQDFAAVICLTCDTLLTVGDFKVCVLLFIHGHDSFNLIQHMCDPLCEIQAKVSKSNYEITSINV